MSKRCRFQKTGDTVDRLARKKHERITSFSKNLTYKCSHFYKAYEVL